MGKYRTAQGKVIDMSQIAAKNEHVRAVGNMSVNARGDTIDSHGKVVIPVTKKTGVAYQKSVSNRAANIVKKVNKPPVEVDPVSSYIPPVVQEEVAIDPEDLLDEELELEDDDDALEIEALKAEEAKSFVIKPASEAPEFFDPKSEKTKK